MGAANDDARKDAAPGDHHGVFSATGMIARRACMRRMRRRGPAEAWTTQLLPSVEVVKPWSQGTHSPLGLM